MEQNKSLDLNSFGISTSKNNYTAEQKKELAKLTPVLSKLGSLTQAQRNSETRIKEIKSEMKEKNKKLLQELKEIKTQDKIREEQILMLLGARAVCIKNAKELGVKFEQKDVAQITSKAASRKEIVAAELVEV